MVDETHSGGGSAASICPWCSASYTGTPEDCPSCGAALTADPAMDASLPGLTAIDAAALVRAKTPVARPRNRFLSWLSGEYPDEGTAPADAAALAPPDLEVRREILRLELEADIANLQAEADALAADAAIEGRAPGATPAEVAAASETVEALGTVQADLEQVEDAIEADLDAVAAAADAAAPDAEAAADAADQARPA